jgi:hypothetical protein
MEIAGQSIDSVPGTNAGHRLPAKASALASAGQSFCMCTTLASGCMSITIAGNRWPAARQRWDVFVEAYSNFLHLLQVQP